MGFKLHNWPSLRTYVNSKELLVHGMKKKILEMEERQLPWHEVEDTRPKSFSGMKRAEKERHYANNFM